MSNYINLIDSNNYMQTSIKLKIRSFQEEQMSISGIKNIMISSKETYWETPSRWASVHIEFEPIEKFEIVICILYSGIMTTLTLNVYHETRLLYSQLITVKNDCCMHTISSNALKIPNPSETNNLTFEFLRNNKNIKVCFLVMRTAKVLKTGPKGKKNTVVAKKIKKTETKIRPVRSGTD